MFNKGKPYIQYIGYTDYMELLHIVNVRVSPPPPPILIQNLYNLSEPNYLFIANLSCKGVKF